MPNKRSPQKKSDRYSYEVCEYLKYAFSSYEWEANHFLFANRSVCVDVCGRPKTEPGNPVLIEAELLREDPVSNVAKIWKCLYENKGQFNLAEVFHIFSKAYQDKGRKVARRKLAEFIANQMCSHINCSYYVIDSKYNPRPGFPKGGGRTLDNARNDAEQIATILRKMLPRDRARRAQAGE